MIQSSLKAVLGAAAGLALAVAVSAPAMAGEHDACKTVRFSDVGWTDITATTAAASVVLEALGYEPDVQVLSVPVTYRSLQNNDIDVFLGNWMPTMEADISPYLEDGSVEVVGTNLEGAKYTLAVPQYTYDAGLQTFSDIAEFADQLGNEIYGIEPGNDGNRLILEMFENDSFGLGGFELVESSEQGMLSAVARAARDNKIAVQVGSQGRSQPECYLANRYIANGKLKAHKVGVGKDQRWEVSEEDLEAFGRWARKGPSSRPAQRHRRERLVGPLEMEVLAPLAVPGEVLPGQVHAVKRGDAAGRVRRRASASGSARAEQVVDRVPGSAARRAGGRNLARQLPAPRGLGSCGAGVGAGRSGQLREVSAAAAPGRRSARKNSLQLGRVFRVQ